MSDKWKKMLIIVLISIFIGSIVYMSFKYDSIGGADEKIGVVVKQYAEKAGVSERKPYINTDKGDILLFLFCISGVIAGFYLGYNWKKIVSEKPDISEIIRIKAKTADKPDRSEEIEHRSGIIK